jgi:hypothetical protein
MERKILPIPNKIKLPLDFIPSTPRDNAIKRRNSGELGSSGKKLKNYTPQSSNVPSISKKINFPPDSPMNTPARRTAPRLLNAYGMMPETSSASKKKTRKNSVCNERIKVCVRKRPLSNSEESNGIKDIVVVDREERSLSIECSRMGLDGLSRSNGYMKFFYDHVFNETHSNTQVFLISNPNFRYIILR